MYFDTHLPSAIVAEGLTEQQQGINDEKNAPVSDRKVVFVALRLNSAFWALDSWRKG